MSFPPRMTPAYALDLSAQLGRPVQTALPLAGDGRGGAAPSRPAARAISFEVHGKAQPAGSKRGFIVGGKVVVTDAAKGSRPWKALVADAARQAYSGPLLEGPLQLIITEHRLRPKGHVGKRGLTKAGREQPFPSGRPDLLKIARGIEDALSGVIYRDDAQIVTERLTKVWGPAEMTHVLVTELVS